MLSHMSDVEKVENTVERVYICVHGTVGTVRLKTARRVKVPLNVTTYI